MNPSGKIIVDTGHISSATADESVRMAPMDADPGQPPHARNASQLAWLLLGLIALLYIGTCIAPVIFDDNEGLYAGAVREMHQRGDWLVPTTNGFPRVQKPPFVYWTMLLSTSAFGLNEFALRLPNALATVGWIGATYLLMRRLGGERFGLATAVVLASMLGVWIFNHLVQPEPFLACFISLAIWCLVEARLAPNLYIDATPTQPGRFSGTFSGIRWYWLFWIFLGLGALSKGLHGALWPLGTVLLTALVAPGSRLWLKPVLSARGLAIFLILLVPWYAYMALHFRGFLAAHFLNEQLGASLNTRYPVDAKQLPLLQFYGQHLIFWMPWTLLLPGALYAFYKARQSSLRTSPLLSPAKLDIVKLLACWLVLTMVSVAFSTRQDYYSMSSWGVVAGFLSMPWILPEIAPIRMPRLFLAVPCAFVAMGGVAALGIVAWATPKLSALGAATATPIQERNTFMDAIAGISPALWGHFITLLAIFGAAMAIAGVASTVLAWRSRSFAALLVLGGAMAVPVCLATAGFSMMSPYFSLANPAAAINREIAAQPDALVACEALPNTASSLYFYLNARVHWVNAPFNQDYSQRVLGQGREFYWDSAAVQAAWVSPHPVYFIIEESRLDYWRTALQPAVRVVAKSGTRLVLGNR